MGKGTVIGVIVSFIILAVIIVVLILLYRWWVKRRAISNMIMPINGGGSGGGGGGNSIPTCPPFATVQNTNIAGSAMPNMPINNQTEEQCQTACQAQGCDWYNYGPNNQCWLKQADSLPNYVTGFRVPNPTAGCTQFDRIVNKNITGSNQSPNTVIANQTEQQCQAACIAQNCNWYAYDQTGQNCWLNQATTISGVDTGFPISVLPQGVNPTAS